MTGDWQRWPALAGIGDISAIALRCELGLWGKPHGQSSDFRWLARSEGFARGLPDLARSLRIGTEDRAARFFAWRALSSSHGIGYFALSVRPSQALDASGRSALLDKLALQWHPESACIPAALAAIVWLEALEQSTIVEQWTLPVDGSRADANAIRQIPSDETPKLLLSTERIARVLEEARQALIARIDAEQLGEVYAQLLSGQTPALLASVAEPLPAIALAALLLPLSPHLASRCSLAGWLPSARIDRDDLSRNWDLICTPQARVTRKTDIDRDHVVRGAKLAEALLAGEPDVAGTSALHVRSADRYGSASDEDIAAKPSNAMEAQPIREIWLQPSRSARLDLRPPNRPGLGALYRFADRVSLRRLDLRQLRVDFSGAYPALAPGENPSDHTLLDWLRTLERGAPAEVDSEDWAFKTEQLRAAALFLLPHPETLPLIGLPRKPEIPALLAALCCDPDIHAARLLDHGPESLELMAAHSSVCPSGTLASAIGVWLSRWRANTRQARSGLVGPKTG